MQVGSLECQVLRRNTGEQLPAEGGLPLCRNDTSSRRDPLPLTLLRRPLTRLWRGSGRAGVDRHRTTSSTDASTKWPRPTQLELREGGRLSLKTRVVRLVSSGRVVFPPERSCRSRPPCYSLRSPRVRRVDCLIDTHAPHPRRSLASTLRSELLLPVGRRPRLQRLFSSGRHFPALKFIS